MGSNPTILCSHERFQDFRDVFIFIPGDVFTMGFFVLQNLQKPLHPDFFLFLSFSFPSVEPSTFSDAIALPVAAKGNTALNPKYFNWERNNFENRNIIDTASSPFFFFFLLNLGMLYIKEVQES